MPPTPEPKVSELIGKAIADAQRLALAQIALAKKELSASGESAGKGGVFGVVALLLVAQASFFMLFALVYVLVQLGLPPWASFLIVALLLLAGAAIAGLMARKYFERVKAPEVAVSEFEKTREAILGPATSNPPTTTD